jgi:hypothetical protein
VTEDAAIQEHCRAGFYLVIEGASSQDDWSVVVVADLVWEIEILPNYGGWNVSLAKMEF